MPQVGGKVLAADLEINGRADRTWPTQNTVNALAAAGHVRGSSVTQMLAHSIRSFPKLCELIGPTVAHPPTTDERTALQRDKALCPKSIMLEWGLEPRFLTFPSNAFIHKRLLVFKGSGQMEIGRLHLLSTSCSRARCSAPSHVLFASFPAALPGPCVTITPFQ